MGCGNSFRGGRCDDGSDPVNCIYETAGVKGALKCSGIFHLEKVPENNSCKDQRGLFKCILNEYSSNSKCKESCPGTCNGVVCKVSNAISP